LLKLIKNFFKFIEGILYIYLPIIIFYWSLTLTNLDFVKPFTAILGSFIDPLMEPWKWLIYCKVDYDGYTIDYTLLLYAGVVLILALIFTVIGKFLIKLENFLNNIKNGLKRKELLRKKRQEKDEQIKVINKNKVIFMILKLTKSQAKETYLTREGTDDFFSVGLVDSYETSLLNDFRKFEGREYKNKNPEYLEKNIIFNDLERLIEFFPFFERRIEDVNKGMLDLNIKFDYKIACHCSLSEASADIDFEITSNILNLCGTREILLSEMLKNRLDLLQNPKFKLFSRGIYLIKDKQMDVFKFKYSPDE